MDRTYLKHQPLRVFRMNPDSPTKRAAGTIAICTRDHITAGTAMSWLMLDLSFLSPLEYAGRFFIQGNVLTMQRNACLTEMEGDWILFIDDDMTFQPDALSRLLATQKETGADIVGGLCFQRGEPFQPTLYVEKDGKGYTFLETWDDGAVVDVDATGLAFLLVTTQALRKIVAADLNGHAEYEAFIRNESFHTLDWSEVEWPSVEQRRQRPPNVFQWDGTLGEDMAFCKIAKAAGCRIVVDTSVEIGHIGEITITRKHFLQELALRDDAAYEARRAQLGELGHEPMTQAEALRRLGFTVSEE